MSTQDASAPDDWVSVARTIDDRITLLGWRQRDLARRSQVSQAIIRELQYNTTRRRRSARTLEALSIALGLHPNHLNDVRLGKQPSPAGQIAENTGAPSLETIERQLAQILTKLNDLQLCQRNRTDHFC
ncbi:hypothetical protein LV75_001785 [Actinokineospora diospyrosa]|uniref:Helix-turn-helix protein n=1 Tax=Actinokineospora diospyrosa TaxID=103728 RepID=A0ABT1I9I6_9PSEU|nr:hypothetical protein [Actinokineospora diospyrosa]